MKNLQIEALFGGVLAMVVLGIAIYAVANTNFGAPGDNTVDPSPSAPTINANPDTATIYSEGGQDLVCECYDQAFALAGRVDVQSPEYRTGFEQCRARGGVEAGDAWTAGWNSRLSGAPYEASCKAYRRRR